MITSTEEYSGDSGHLNKTIGKAQGQALQKSEKTCYSGGGSKMKKAISLALVLIMMLSCISLVACGGGEEEAPTPSPTSEPATTPSGSGLTWNDMPVYSGTGQVQKGSWSIPPAEGEWLKVEWRYYETSDSINAVATFYKSQMPGNGWQETMWMEIQEMSWGIYNKNDEQDAAMVWIGSEEGKTFFALMRASE